MTARNRTATDELSLQFCDNSNVMIINIAWALIACSLALVAVPTCDLIPLTWFIKPIGAILAALAFALAVTHRPALLPVLARDAYSRVLSAFVGIAVLATIVGVASGQPMLKGSTAHGAALKALASLGIGISTWLGLRCLVRTPYELILAERWLWGGLTVSVAVALVQSAASLGIPGCQSVVTWTAQHIAGAYMLDGRTPGRSWGLSPEPSLLGSQLAVAGMVPALARLFIPGPADGPRWVPWAALAVCCLGLGLSRSRTGLGLALLLVPSAMALTWWLRSECRRGLAFTSAGTALLLGAMVGIASLNPHLRSTTSGALGGSPSADRATAGGMASRLGAWSAGLVTAREHPVLGVGLGLAPWGVVQHLPAWSLRNNAETQAWIDPAPGPLPNIKHLWIRLAAETGVLGLLAFLAFLAWVAWPRRSDQPATKLIAVLAGLAVIGDGFSLDSFALPTMWTVLALVAARRQAQADPEPCAAS